MFGIIADLLTLLATTLFPLFAAYKALKAPAPTTLAPWLVFYATVSVIYLLESTILLPLTIIPGYAWLRLLVHLYLLLPAPEGAARVYNAYIEPFLAEHEASIEEFISQAHDRGKTAGLQYLRQGIEWFRVNILGQEPQPPPPAQNATYTTYAQQLLARFYGQPPSSSGNPTVPSSGGVLPGSAAESLGHAVSSLLQSLGTTGATSRSSPSAENMADSSIIPPQFNQTPTDRLNYVRQTQESLRVLLQLFAREEGELERSEDDVGLSKSRSETEFDKIERDEVGSERETVKRTTSSGSWIPWRYAKADPAAASKKDDGDDDAGVHLAPEAKSTGIDLGH